MEVRLSKSAEKYYLAQDAVARSRIKSGLAGLQNEPMAGDIVPVESRPGMYRLRIGKLRILFEKADDIIKVTKIDSRGQVYKK